MSKVIYRGNPGYMFQPLDGEPFSPAPGEVLDLPSEVRATVGDEFAPAGRSTPKGEFNPATAKKAELIDHAEVLGLDVDESATVADLRAAIEAHQEAAASAAGDTDPAEEAD